MKKLDFIKIAVKDYKRVGAVSISSKHAIKKIIKKLKPDYKYIIEYGAGSGSITKELLKFIPSGGKIIAVELNRELFKELSKLNDRRLKVVPADIFEVSKNLQSLGLPEIDAVISGVPLAFLKSSTRKEIIKNTYDNIKLGGRFVVYQISPMIVPAMKRLFKKVHSSVELRNIPPYFIITGEK